MLVPCRPLYCSLICVDGGAPRTSRHPSIQSTISIRDSNPHDTNPQSTANDHQSTGFSPQSSPQSTVHSPQSAVHSPQSTVYSPQSTVHSPQSESAVYSLQSTVYSLQSTVRSPQSAVHSPQSTQSTAHGPQSTVQIYCNTRYRIPIAPTQPSATLSLGTSSAHTSASPFVVAYISRCDGNQESRPFSGRARPLSLDPPRAAAAATARRCTALRRTACMSGVFPYPSFAHAAADFIGEKRKKIVIIKTTKTKPLFIHTFVIHTHPSCAA